MNEILKKLRLPRIRTIYPEWVKKAENEDMGYVDFLRGLLEEELCSREEKRLKTLMRKARFPFHKSLTEWGGIINDNALASALIDRLLHHGDVYYLKGESYRLKDKDRSIKQGVRGETNEMEESLV